VYWMGVVIVEGEGAVLGVNLGRPIPLYPMGALRCSCATATRSSQMTLGRTCQHSSTVVVTSLQQVGCDAEPCAVQAKFMVFLLSETCHMG